MENNAYTAINLPGKSQTSRGMFCGFESRLFTKNALVFVLVRDFPSWSWTLPSALSFRMQMKKCDKSFAGSFSAENFGFPS